MFQRNRGRPVTVDGIGTVWTWEQLELCKEANRRVLFSCPARSNIHRVVNFPRKHPSSPQQRFIRPDQSRPPAPRSKTNLPRGIRKTKGCSKTQKHPAGSGKFVADSLPVVTPVVYIPPWRNPPTRPRPRRRSSWT